MESTARPPQVQIRPQPQRARRLPEQPSARPSTRHQAWPSTPVHPGQAHQGRREPSPACPAPASTAAFGSTTAEASSGRSACPAGSPSIASAGSGPQAPPGAAARRGPTIIRCRRNLRDRRRHTGNRLNRPSPHRYQQRTTQQKNELPVPKRHENLPHQDRTPETRAPRARTIGQPTASKSTPTKQTNCHGASSIRAQEEGSTWATVRKARPMRQRFLSPQVRLDRIRAGQLAVAVEFNSTTGAWPSPIAARGSHQWTRAQPGPEDERRQQRDGTSRLAD